MTEVKKPRARKTPVVATSKPKPAAKKPSAKTPVKTVRKTTAKATSKTVKKTPVKRTTTTKKPVKKEVPLQSAMIGSNNITKEEATAKGLPWVAVLSVEIDPNNVGYGAFELDWNDKFLIQLTRAGYRGKDDNAIVDQWFNDVCRNVVMETYEQEMANNPDYTNVVDMDQKRSTRR